MDPTKVDGSVLGPVFVGGAILWTVASSILLYIQFTTVRLFEFSDIDAEPERKTSRPEKPRRPSGSTRQSRKQTSSAGKGEFRKACYCSLFL